MQPQLFMILLGCRPKGRHTEQHDVFFGIAADLSSLKQQMQKFWPGTLLHIDAWRTVSNVDGYAVKVISNEESKIDTGNQLFFINLGGYKNNEFEEFHYKMLTVAAGKTAAMKTAVRTAFYKHTSLPGTASAHIDDRFGVDVDDIFAIKDILPDDVKKQFHIQVSNLADDELAQDELYLGYKKWSSL